MNSSLFGDGLIVNYPRAIPDRQWVLDRLLWAERLGSVWPAGQPTDRSKEEKSVMTDLATLEGANLFTPCRVDGHDPDLAKDIAERLTLSDDQLQRWLDPIAFEPAGHEAGPKARRPKKADPNLYFYINKMPPDVVGLLEEARVARRTEDGWLEVPDSAHADMLIGLVANRARPEGGYEGPVLLDASEPRELALSATPGVSGESHAAVQLHLPLLPPVNPQASIDQVAEFRESKRGSQARRDYLDSVTAYVRSVERVVESDSTFTEKAAHKVRSDVAAAAKELQQSSGLCDPSLAMGSFAAAVSLTAVDNAAGWVGAALAVGQLVLGYRAKIRPSNVEGYLCALHTRGFVAVGA